MCSSGETLEFADVLLHGYYGSKQSSIHVFLKGAPRKAQWTRGPR